MVDIKDKRCIFLDFDGVINNIGYKDTPEIEAVLDIHNDFIPHATLDNIVPLTKLFTWCYLNNIQIVISSSWMIKGYLHCVKALKELLGNVLVDRVVVGGTVYTHRLKEPVRSQEINMWLAKNREYKYFVILDDSDSFSDDHKKVWVKTIWNDGLTDEKVDEVIAMFKNIDTKQPWIDKEYYRDPIIKRTENDL